MRAILSEIGLKESNMPSNSSLSEGEAKETNYCGWILLPMVSRDLCSNDLGSLLEHALEAIRIQASGGDADL